MQQVIFGGGQGEFTWVDVVDPKPQELDELALQYPMSAAFIQDCMDPTHLPKFEIQDKVTFLILRAYDFDSNPEADSVQDLTRKVACLLGPNFLITVHRKPQPYIDRLMQKWKSQPGPRTERMPLRILGSFFEATIESYLKPIEDDFDRLEGFETNIFMERANSHILEDIYYLKRKASIYKRMIRLQSDLISITKMQINLPSDAVHQLRDTAERAYFQADGLLENATNLLNAHISLSSHRTNEVMRILTVFSVFFMPLTFIVGVYGMNFRVMPELNHPWGYAGVWLLMFFVSALIYAWFHRRGWIWWKD